MLKLYGLREERETHAGFPLYVYEIVNAAREREVLYTHWHNEHEIIYVSQGTATFRVGENAWTLGPDDLLFVNSGEIHGGHSAGLNGCTWNAIVFEMSMLSSGTGDDCDADYIIPLCQNRLKLRSFQSANDETTRQVRNCVLQIIHIWNTKPFGFKLKIKGLLYDLLYSMSRNNFTTVDNIEVQDQRLIQHVITYISERIASSISLNDLAELAHMSRYHFCRWFKGYTGMRPVEYINSTRVNKAANLLLNGAKISESAFQVGFNDLTYFSRVFKDYKQISPTVYQRLYCK